MHPCQPCLIMWGFNRTFMELKLQDIPDLFSLILSFNRTFMELKFSTLILLPDEKTSSNRTFMEFKFNACNRFSFNCLHVLIVPLWN